MDNKEKMRIILPFIVLAICVPIIVDFFIFGNSFHSNISNESSDGVVFGTSKAHKATRKELVENQLLEAVISLPSGIFRPYSDVSTSILIFTKTNAGGTENVWFYDMQADGFSLDDKREEVEENDIPDIITRFSNLEAEKERSRKEKSFMVSKEDIAKNGYSLRMKEYKEIEYQKIEYPSSEELLNDVDALKDELVASLQELRGLLS